MSRQPCRSLSILDHFSALSDPRQRWRVVYPLRVIALDAELFKACFISWVETLRDGDPEIIAVDGKTSRRSHARAKGREPLHLVSAWATRQRLTLGQQATDVKSNEITAIQLLLERLELTGALVTIDAMGTQAAIADAVVAKGGD
ncbi:hypothetical protein A9K71_17150 [Mesorhizobium sp. WSM3873]|nr:hypothetical protein A9K71_17150 [Mesorhizobium sp. WSM3873]